MGEIEALREEVEHLRRELRRSERTVRQLRRTAETYEYAAERGQEMMLHARNELQETVDELQRMTTELAMAKAQAEHSTAARTRFLATISHELRTPLSGLVASTELLTTTHLEPAQHELVELLRRSARSLSDLVGDILDFARLDEGRLSLEDTDFDLATCVQDVVDLFVAVCRARGVALRSHAEPGLPRYVRGDPLRLRQVLLNLVDNACKFTEAGSVTVRYGPQGDQVRFDVIDTGIGFDVMQFPRLLEPFTQLDDTTTRRFGGSGLGLAISRRLVGLMGGELSAASTPGAGSTFTFTVPLVEANNRPADLALPAPSITRGARVLVVDDNLLNLHLAQRMLEHLGHMSVAANGGRQALERLADGPFDLVLMDLSMPDLDGYAATLALRGQERDGQHLPVVALTAHTSASEVQRARSCGMDDHLAKPFTLEQLARVVKRWARP